MPQKNISKYAGLDGKTIVVTGAGGGIGLEICRALLGQGADVVGVDKTLSAALLSLAKNKRLRARRCDLASDKARAALIKFLQKQPVYGLVNNAAIFDMAPLFQSTLKMQDRLFAVNVRAPFHLMQACADIMRRQNIKGAIVNFSSQAGRRGEPLVSHYCAGKAAIISYTQSAALALAPFGIRANAVAPGVINTPMWNKVDALFARYENRKKGEKKKLVGQAVPLGHMGRPKDIVGAVLFLLSADSAYITGQTLNIDGGNVLS